MLPGKLILASLPWLLLGFLLSESQAVLFEEISPVQSGIHWVHENAMSARRYLPETMGPGAAFLDYNNDGWMDLYLVNTGPCDFFTPSRPLSNALYRNNRDGTFTDVTIQAGVRGGTFGMGVSAADFDNDGYPDIFVTSYGKCILYRNNRDGTFANVTDKAGVSAPGWTTSAVWFDYNNDGGLDLFVCSFVEFSVDLHISCGLNALGQNYYCVPRVFTPTHSLLFRNNGDGTFSDVTAGTAILKALGKALGVVATDVNNDGWMDLFVANDTVQNFLFVNRGENRWEEIALFAGVAFSTDGEVRSGMGVDAADFDADGWQDLFVANVDRETYSLYWNKSDESFEDAAQLHGVAQATFLLSGWGLKFFDVENDGDLDLFLANGHPDDMIHEYVSNVTYREPLLLFRNSSQRLEDISLQAGPVFSKIFNARGMAVGDYNNDGLLDVLVANNGEPPLLLRNASSRDNHWIGLRLQGTNCNRDALGARIRWSVNGTIRSRLKTGGGSYLSSHDVREVLGLGPANKVDWIEIQWPKPSHQVQRLTNLPSDRYLTIVEAKGIVSP